MGSFHFSALSCAAESGPGHYPERTSSAKVSHPADRTSTCIGSVWQRTKNWKGVQIALPIRVIFVRRIVAVEAGRELFDVPASENRSSGRATSTTPRDRKAMSGSGDSSLQTQKTCGWEC